MDLLEAIKYLKNGKRIRKKDWPYSRYIALNKDGKICDENGEETNISLNDFETLEGEWALQLNKNDLVCIDCMRFRIVRYCKTRNYCGDGSCKLEGYCFKNEYHPSQNLCLNWKLSKIESAYALIKDMFVDNEED